MKYCKKHTTDLSSTVGVCASCLRERLIKLLEAQEQITNPTLNSVTTVQQKSNSSVNSVTTAQQKSDNSANSVSTAQRLHNKPRLNHSLSDQRFFYSPQIAINTTGATSSNKTKKNLIKFSSFSNLFRSNADRNPNSTHKRSVSVSVSTSGEPSGVAGKPTSVTSSPLWLSAGRRDTKPIHVNESSKASGSGVRRRQRRVRDRGMSPVRCSDDESSDEDLKTSDYESAEAESFKQTPRRTPSHPAVRRGRGQRSVTDLVFCLSPLVQASPSRLWSLKGKPPVDGGFPAVPHISDVKSFCGNGSRKLADYGRSGRNR